jgi:PhoH-like ATPase
VHSDNAIIECCLTLKSANPRKKVAVITKDTGLRIRAITWGCQAENYKADQLEDREYTGIRNIACENQSDWSILWSDTEIKITSLSNDLQSKLKDLNPNEFVIFEYGESKCPSFHKNGTLKILKEKSNSREARGYSGIQGKNLEQKCALEILTDLTIPLVTLAGKAGTGKSFLALAAALQMINENIYDKIVVMKPLIPVGGKDIGALPGDKFEKIAAWLGPIKDNIDQILGPNSLSANNKFEEMVREGIIEVEAMAFIQGRSIPRSIIILDEAENITAREARMVIERCGKDSKVILLGDLSQVENPYLDSKSNGLAHAISGGKKNGLVASVTLTKVERSELAAVASDIFNRPEAQRK